jgi:glycogen operon protein
VHGRYAPRQGHRFNKHKLLLDPYAREVVGALRYDPQIYGYSVGSAQEWRQDISDSAASVPKARVPGATAFDWRGDRRPETPWERTVIYELHVKGYTRLHPDLPPHLRGRFLGLAHPAVLEYLTRLGVTAVELMPTQYFVSEPEVVGRGLANYWGYNPLAFSVPHPDYALADAAREFREMVRALHAAGIEVIMDVVFNHTAEGDDSGPTLSLRGIDNLSYYRLDPADARRNINWTGCGNTLNLEHPEALRLVLDSLRYWATEMHVDGFRFDLGTVLGREGQAFVRNGRFFSAVHQDPVLAGLKLIAEPWDLGPDGYRLGSFPLTWAEWNDRFRDDIRGFWRSDPGTVPRFAERLAGSSDIFRATRRRPSASINFVACHDGFTVNDTVSYATKHNEANGENNRDGDGHAVSWNCGVEGPSDDPEIQHRRDKHRRNLLASLLLAQGVPMLQAGDEFGRTQRGNNNAYCQDNEISWLDWRLARSNEALLEFVRGLLAIRSQHAVFRRSDFLEGIHREQARFKDVSWLTCDGREMRVPDWHDAELRAFGMLLDSTGTADTHAAPEGDRFLLLFNSGDEPLDFAVPAPVARGMWEVVFDTSQDAATVPAGGYRKGHVYTVARRSMALLADHGRSPPRRIKGALT